MTAGRTTVSNATQRRITAYHEAGHALAALAHGSGFRYITLRPRGVDSYGSVHLDSTGKRLDRLRWFRPEGAAQVLLCGPTAEALHRCMTECPPTADPDARTEHRYGHAFNFLVVNRDLPEVGEVEEITGVPLSDQAAAAVWLLLKTWQEVETLAEAALSSPRAVTLRHSLDLLAFSDLTDAAHGLGWSEFLKTLRDQGLMASSLSPDQRS